MFKPISKFSPSFFCLRCILSSFGLTTGLSSPDFVFFLSKEPPVEFFLSKGFLNFPSVLPGRSKDFRNFPSAPAPSERSKVFRKFAFPLLNFPSLFSKFRFSNGFFLFSLFPKGFFKSLRNAGFSMVL